jgi:hypothetical protein
VVCDCMLMVWHVSGCVVYVVCVVCMCMDVVYMEEGHVCGM